MKENTSNSEKVKNSSFWIAFLSGFTISFVSNYASIPVTIIVALILYCLYSRVNATYSKLG